MASFTEQATLKVADKSSAQLRKINAELKKLFATAKSLKSIKVDVKINTGNIGKATADIRKLHTELNKLKSLSRALRISVNTGGLAAANAQLARLRQQAARPITVRTQHRGGGGGPAGPGGPNRPSPRSGGAGPRRTPGSAFLGGIGGGIGIGLGRLNETFGLVAVAGYAAAKALRAVASAAEKRDRAELMVDATSSPRQRAVFDAADKAAAAAGEDKGALRYKKDQFKMFRSSVLGDVGNTGKPGDANYVDPKSEAGALERAERADILARELFKTVVPGMYARNPNLSQNEAQEELKKYAQTLGIMTQNIFEKNAQGQTVLSKEYRERVAPGLELGMKGAPDLTLGQIRTMAAAIKSLGYTATPQQIAEIMYNISSKGQRAGNEAYQMYKTGLGVTDVAKLNTAIEDLGLFIPGTAKRNPKSHKVIAGTGIPIEFNDPETGEPIKLGERPSEWWRQAMQSPEVQKRAKDMLVKQAVDSLPKGSTKAQKAKAVAEAENKYKEGEAVAVTDYINRALAGARGTALQGILDSILGGQIAKSGLAQAGEAPGWAELNRQMTEHWTVQASNLGTAVADAAGDLGKLAAESIGLANILRGMTNFVDQNPLMSGAIAIAIGTAVSAAVLIPMGRAAAALIRAAAVIGGGTAAAAGATGAVIGSVGRLGTIMRVGGTLMRVANGVGVALTAAEVTYYLATRSAEQAAKDMEQVNAAKELVRKQERAQAIEREQDLQKDTPQSEAQKTYMAEQAKVLEGLRVDIAKLNGILGATPVESVDPDSKMSTQAEVNAQIAKAVAEALAKGKPPEEKPKDRVKSTATERAEAAAAAAAAAKTATPPPAETKPPAVTPAMAAAAAPANVSALTNLIPQLIQSATSITTGASTLATSSGTFATVFSTGAKAIGDAGTTAANALSGQAPDIGAKIGAAAAKAISGAVSNLSISVNAKVNEGPNRGARPATQ
jgi:hypothetical protein